MRVYDLSSLNQNVRAHLRTFYFFVGSHRNGLLLHVFPKAGANTTATGRSMEDSARDLFTRSSISGINYQVAEDEMTCVFFLQSFQLLET